MVAYRRSRLPGGSYFFTVTLLNRSSRLLIDHIADLRAAFRSVHCERPFTIDAIVILPDHLHCIWRLPPGDADYSIRWREIKTRFSRSVSTNKPRTSAQGIKHERGIWQRRFWEHTLRYDRDRETHADYIHYNPVKHGYVNRVAVWPYSSFHRCVRMGIYPMDWGGRQNDRESGFGE